MSAEASRNRRLRILLIEDNLADVMLIKEALSEHEIPADLEVLTDGEAAYNYWSHFADSSATAYPDLVLLDLNLPKRNGLEILQRMRELPSCEAMQVVVISSSINPKDIQQATVLGVDQYFRKPSHFEEFLELGRIIKELQNGQEKTSGSGSASA